MSKITEILTQYVDEPIYNGGTFPVVTIKPELETDTNKEKIVFLFPIVVVFALIYVLIKR